MIKSIFIPFSIVLGIWFLWHPFFHVFVGWTPPVDLICGDALRIDGIIPFSDRFLCVIENAKLELNGSSSRGSRSSSLGALTLFTSLELSVFAFIAVEGTRRLPNKLISAFLSSFAVVVVASLLVSPAVAVPLIWIPAFFTASVSTSRSFSKLHLGPAHQITRIGISIVALMCISAFLEYTHPADFFYVKTVLTQYFPPLLPLFWITAPQSSTTTIHDAKKSSNRALLLYMVVFFMSLVHFTTRSFFPLVIQNNPLETIPPLVELLLSTPPPPPSPTTTTANSRDRHHQHHHHNQHPQIQVWFQLWEWVSLTVATTILVVVETWNLSNQKHSTNNKTTTKNNPDPNSSTQKSSFFWLASSSIGAMFSHLSRSLVIGPGASFMVFTVWRETRLFERMQQVGDERPVDRLRNRVATIGIAASFVGSLSKLVKERKERESSSDDEEVVVVEKVIVAAAAAAAPAPATASLNSRTVEKFEGVGFGSNSKGGSTINNSNSGSSKKKRKNKNKRKSETLHLSSPDSVPALFRGDLATTPNTLTAARETPQNSSSNNNNNKLNEIQQPHNTIDSNIPKSQAKFESSSALDANTEIELIFSSKTSYLKKALVWIFRLCVLFFFGLTGLWYYKVGYDIQYCPELNNQTASSWTSIPINDSLMHGYVEYLFPVCISCPDGAVCVGRRVEQCEQEGFEVYGDEGLGPLGAYLGLGPVCLEERFYPVNTETDSHINPRIRGRPLTVSERLKVNFWTPSVKSQLSYLQLSAMHIFLDVYYKTLDVAISVRENGVHFFEWVSSKIK